MNNRFFNISSIILFLQCMVIFGVLSTSCNTGINRNATDAFSNEIKNGFDQIIAFHDSIVKANTPGIAKIDDAYIHYLDSVCPMILKQGDFSQSGIDAGLRKKLFNKVDEHGLSEIFIVGDTLEYFSMNVKKRVKRYFPNLVRMNNEGAYADLIKKLSTDNSFISKYFTSWMNAGDLSPGCYGMILRDYNKLDFSNPDHRLLYTVTILRVNEKIADRFMH